MLTPYRHAALHLGFVAGLGLALSVGGIGLTGCSSDSGTGTGNGTGDGGGGGTGGGDGGGGGTGTGGGKDAGGTVDAGSDAAAATVNSCKTFVDRTDGAASRTLTWDFSIANAAERCITIKKGQDVTFSGDFGTHPLNASGGDTPNPVANVDGAGKVSFATAGTFGFVCGNHPAMTGAVQVVE